MIKGHMIKDKKKKKLMAANCKMKPPEEAEPLIRRFRTLRTVYNECARSIEIHCHQLTFWSENIVPTMTDKELSEHTSLAREKLLPSASNRQHILRLLNVLKENLSEHYQRLLTLKKAFDKLYYSKTNTKDPEAFEKLLKGYNAIEEQLCQLQGVRFVPCDSLLWEPKAGKLGTLEEFTIEVSEPLKEPEKLIDCPPHSIIKSPVSLIKTIFKRPLSVFTSSSSQPRNLIKSKSTPKLTEV